MAEVQTFQPVTASEIVDAAKNMLNEGYRLIQLCCTKTPSEMDIIYTFEKTDLQSQNFKLPVNIGDTLPSISSVFFAAFLYENEIHDLYGVNFTDMAVDFKGTFYETSVKQAFSITVAEDKE
ncbi:MAG: NAD(P)H-quinone oxidoreductase subunit J, chloroplastic [Candidatus Dichloromethanomonas elyunquensis]|nr:MAG: NAD(P)H-quinone oxidoreductase subunit J, chloroplastic [Candidatus Dichloromethanomonas elyunquensis]